MPRFKITALVTALALLCLAALWATLTLRRPRQQPGPAAHAGTASGLFCPEPIKDFGEIGFSEVAHTFRLTNRSSAPITISAVRRSCNCAAVTFETKALNPGETTTVDLKLSIVPKTPGAVAHFREHVQIMANDPVHPAAVLVVQGRYIPPLYSSTTRARMSAPTAT